MNTITIELPGIEAKLDRIIELLERVTTHDCERCANSVATVMSEALTQSPAPAPDEEPQMTEETTPEEKPAEAKETAKAEPTVYTVSRSDIQKKVVALSAADKKDAVKEIVQAYASRVSAIPEEKLTEVWLKLTGLEG